METTQVKVSVDTQIASAFKKACAGAGISMASELSGFMASYAGGQVKHKAAPDYSTRRRRRAEIRSIIEQLGQIQACEEKVRDNMPENLQGSSAYETAEEAVSSLEEAIDALANFWTT
jgi:hypothetical protein